MVFLSRHGRGHRLLPTEMNFRANIYGMKQLGVEHLVSVSTAGSMKEELRPGDLVVPDQFIDHTYKRPATFFGDGIVAHVSLADPVCAALARELFESAGEDGATVHRGGVYLCIEGPQFSTRAESNLYRSWGVDVISMTAMQEARLAREAEICYAALVLVTDYDCWHRERRGGRYWRNPARDAAQRRASRRAPWRTWRGGSRRAGALARARNALQRCDHHRPRGDSAQGGRRSAADNRQILAVKLNPHFPAKRGA